jgi:hypothetical protein
MVDDRKILNTCLNKEGIVLLIRSRTVLILGAGASKPYGLPLGSELRDDVLNVLKGLDIPAYNLILRRCEASKMEFENFCTDLAQSGYSSVDAFLEERQEWTNIGKLAMAFSLLLAESRAKKKLFPPHQPKDHWYEVLWSRLKAPSWPEFKNQPVSIVTFNYDRSLEHYLSGVLTNNYSIEPEIVWDALPILHVHGSLGKYNGSFGLPITEEMHKMASDSIRIVHETDLKHSGFIQVREMLSATRLLLFIGFGYHQANMRKLGLGIMNKIYRTPPTTLGTHKGIKAPTWKDLCKRYKFRPDAEKYGAGSISEFVAEWLV